MRLARGDFGSGGSILKVFKWAGICFGATIAIIIAAIATGAFLFDQNAKERTPAGYARNSALYVVAADGTRIAIDVWLPPDLDRGVRIPTLIKATPYWRGRELTVLGKAFAQFLDPTLAQEPDIPLLSERGYAVVTVDARGTGASFGTIGVMFSDAEINDYSSVADWIAQQPWSDGNVGAYGFSYRGISAANIAALPNPHIRAVAPLFDLSDLHLLAYPGGAFAEYLITAWSRQTASLNSGRSPCSGLCALLIEGPKPVDADANRDLLRDALNAHRRNYNVHDCVRAAPARGDAICASGQSLSGNSALARRAQIENRGLPIFSLTGWFDQSSPAQVLHRFRTFSNPQQVIIGPFTHGGFAGNDPFAPQAAPPMGYAQQTEAMADFFDRHLRDAPAEPTANNVRYYVIGANAWRDSPTWPPRNSANEQWYLGAAHSLSTSIPEPGHEDYDVDFGVTTGPLSGHRGQVDLSVTDYGDRAAQDARLLAYTSAPFPDDVEIAGDPSAHIRLSSTATGGLIIVYLEDVAPDGRVTYISQGVLNLAHRRLQRGDSGLSADPLHSYLRADMTPMTPGTFEDVAIAISPIAALIRQGHRLRLAIAGADAGNLERLPARGAARLTVQHGAATYVELPVRQD